MLDKNFVHMDRNLFTASLAQTICQGIFVVVLTVISLDWLVKKLKKLYQTNSEFSRSESLSSAAEQFRHEQEEHRRHMQEEHNSKVQDYAERILKPREDAKRLKKEKEFSKFLGPAWEGEGTTLGHGDSDQAEDADNGGSSPGRAAAQKRKIPENINKKVAAEAAAAAAAQEKPKHVRIIKLPEEPDINDEGVIVVLLRTPIGTVFQRRFHSSDKIQCLLDYITTQGFSQRQYTISTSFPRKVLEDPLSSLSDYDFGKRVALNIEERG